MSTKKIDLKFNFSSSVPGSGGANRYRDTVPGVRLTEAERNKHSLSGRRFEEYERVIQNISEIIGEISFDDGAFAPADRNIGGYFQKIEDNLSDIQAKLDIGSFPVRETFGTGIFRNFAQKTPEATSVLSYNEKLFPGLFNHSPEFDIIDIEAIADGVNRFYITGGKALFPRGIGNFPTRSNLYTVDVEPPKLVKNVEFSINDDIFPMEAKNNINFVLEPGGWALDGGGNTDCYVARLPIQFSSNQLPINYPIEPGQMGGGQDAKFIWLQDEENDVIAHLEPTFDQIRYERSPQGNELIIRMLPSVFTDKTAGEPVTGNPKCYIYYMSPAWRYDTIVLHPSNGLMVVTGKNYAESAELDFTQYVPLYFVMVNTYDPDINQIVPYNSWVLKTGLPARIYHDGPAPITGKVIDVRRAILQDNVIRTEDVFNIHSVGRSFRFQPSFPNGKTIKPHNVSGGILQNIRLAAPEVNDPEENIKIYISNKKDSENNEEWTSLGSPSIPIIAPSTMVSINGVSFRLYYHDGSFTLSAKDMSQIAMSPTLEYRVLYDGEEVFHATTKTPEATIPMENLSPGIERIIKYNGTNLFDIQVRILDNPNKLPFFILGDNNHELGSALYLALDIGETVEDSDHLRIFSKDPTDSPFYEVNKFTNNAYLKSDLEYELYVPFVSPIDGYSGGIGLRMTGYQDARAIEGTLHVKDQNGEGDEVITVDTIDLTNELNHFGDLNSSTNQWIRHAEVVSRNGITYLVALIEFEMSSGINDFRCTILVSRINIKSARFFKSHTFIGNRNNGLAFGEFRYIRMKDIIPEDRQKLLRVAIDDSQNLAIALNATYATKGEAIEAWTHTQDTLFTFFLNQNLDIVFSNHKTIANPNIIETGFSLPTTDTTGRAEVITASIDNQISNSTHLTLQLLRSDNFVAIENISYRNAAEIQTTVRNLLSSSERHSDKKILDFKIENNIYYIAVLDSNFDKSQYRIIILSFSLFEDQFIIHEQKEFEFPATLFNNDEHITGKLYSKHIVLVSKQKLIVLDFDGNTVHTHNLSNNLDVLPVIGFNQNGVIITQYSGGSLSEEAFGWGNPKWISTFFNGEYIELDTSNYMVSGYTVSDTVRTIDDRDPERDQLPDEYTIYSGSSFDAGGWKWKHGPINAAINIVDYSGRYLSTPPDNKLEFIVHEHQGEDYVGELEGKVLCISWKSHEAGDEFSRIGCGDIKVYANGNICPLIRKIPGKAWVYITGLEPGNAELSINIINTDSVDLFIYPPTITTGWALAGKTATEQMLRSNIATVIRKSKDYNDVTNQKLDDKLSERINEHAQDITYELNNLKKGLYAPGIVSVEEITHDLANDPIHISNLVAIDTEGRLIHCTEADIIPPSGTTGYLCVSFDQTLDDNSIDGLEREDTAIFSWKESITTEDITLGRIINSGETLTIEIKYSYAKGPDITENDLPAEGLVRKDLLYSVRDDINQRIDDEVTDMQSVMDAKNFIMTLQGTPVKLSIKQEGNYLYWTVDGGVTWRPFL